MPEDRCRRSEVRFRRAEVRLPASGLRLPFWLPVGFAAAFFAANDSQRLDGFGGDSVDGVEALGEQGLEAVGFGDFGFVGRGGKEVDGFDDFFVKLQPFAIARGGLLEGMVDDAGNGVEADGAAFEVVAVNGAKNVFGGDEGERVGRLVHAIKIRSDGQWGNAERGKGNGNAERGRRNAEKHKRNAAGAEAAINYQLSTINCP
jgi:hypothetical protein